MDVTAAMVEFVLRERGIPAHVTGDADCTVERIAIYRTGARDANTLYVTSGKAPRSRAAKRDKHAFLHADSIEPEALLEDAYAALRAIDRWDSQLKDALLNRMPLAEFIRIGADMLACPIAYFDRNLITLASSDDYWHHDESDPSPADGLQVAGQMPSNRAVDLVDDLDYLNAAEKQEPFYYENAQNRIFLGINTFDDGEYLARLVLALPPGSSALHPGEEQLAIHFHHYLDDLYLLYAGNVDVVSSQNDALHALARSSLIEGHAPQASEMAGVLRSCGWDVNDDFIVSKLVFFEGVHWNTISLYLCGLLERAVSASCAFPIDRQIVWLVNLTRSAKPAETRPQQIDRITEALVSIMRDYACKTGISDEFSSLDNAHDYYRESELALEFGQTRDPHYWYYRFGNYAFDYLLAKSVEELPGELLCHPALAALVDYDAGHGTEYARTLVCFLRNSQNTTRAANELFIHRTSFMRRMAQIHDFVEVDLDDSDEVLHLLLSAKLLHM